jgi:hypothetical protein
MPRSEVSTTSAVALVDWDNIVSMRVRTEIDAEAAVDEALETLAGPVLSSCPDLVDLQVRLYGSWQWRNGRDTGFGLLISAAALRSHRRLANTYITASSVGSLAVEAEYDAGPRLVPYLSRTVCRCAHREEINEQKLADTMIVSDAIYYAQFPDFSVVVVSDDIDMSPGLVMASNMRTTVAQASADDIYWLRPTAEKAEARRRFHGLFQVI